MSRKNKRKKPKQRHPTEPESQNDDLKNVAKETAAIFTCAFETARDFLSQCQERREDLEAALVFAHLAVEIWQDKDPRTKDLAKTLLDFVSETQRQVDALIDLEQRLQPLADDENFHIHLHPQDSYFDLIYNRITAPPLSQTVNQSEAPPRFSPDLRGF